MIITPLPARFFALLAISIGASSVSAQQPVSETVQLKTSDLVLEGTLSMPTNATRKIPVVLLIAGSGPTDRDGNGPTGGIVSSASYRILADSLNALGIAVLRYDKRGIAKSKPTDVSAMKEENMRFEQSIQDAVGWVQQLKEAKPFSKIVIAGHSEGSLVGMVAANESNANGYISLAGAGRNINDVLKEQLKTLPEQLRTTAYADLDSLHDGHRVQKPPVLLMNLLRPSVQPYMISWMKYDPAVELKKFKGPVLLIQGKRDGQVAVSEAELLKAARPDAPLLLFDNMTHVLKDAADATPQANLKTYKDPTQPITSGLAKAIADFVKKK